MIKRSLNGQEQCGGPDSSMDACDEVGSSRLAGVARFSRVRRSDAVQRRSRPARQAASLVVPIAAALLLLLAAPALSQADSNDPYTYYSIATGYIGGNGGRGGYGELCYGFQWMYNPDHVYRHVNDTLWVGFPNVTQYWTEVGIANGKTEGGDTNGANRFYWADNSGLYGYNEHFFTPTPQTNTFYQSSVKYYNPPWWSVRIGSNYAVGASYHNVSVMYDLQTGVEFTNPDYNYMQETGSTRNLQWEDNSGNWWDGWPSALDQIDAGDGRWVSNPYYWQQHTTDMGWSC
jgi:hypothetical protein